MPASESIAEVRRSSAVRSAGEIDWLWNTVTISGPAGRVSRFRTAAQGTNAAPWHLDLDHKEARLLAPMASAGIEARLLARELREELARRHERVLAMWDGPGRCPFDLHRLVPIPAHILVLGVDDPYALLWLREHWGTTRPLRLVEVLASAEDKRLRRSARFAVRFQSADWTPWQAIARLRRDWPELRPGPDLALQRPELEGPQTELLEPPSVTERRLRARLGEMVAVQAVEDDVGRGAGRGRSGALLPLQRGAEAGHWRQEPGADDAGGAWGGDRLAGAQPPGRAPAPAG